MITNLSVNPNDVIYVGTGLNSDGSQMIFSITDWTTGETTGNFSEPTYGAVNNDSAEWITEAPSNGSTRYPLANYGTENWLGSYTYGTYSSNQVESGMVVNPLGINPVTIGSYMESNNVLESDVSEPTATNTFTNTWYNY
jgi:Tfp pilus assembly protein PilP